MDMVKCPVCSEEFTVSSITNHVNECLNATEMPKRHVATEDESSETCQPVKRQKTGDAKPHIEGKPGPWSFLMGNQTSSKTKDLDKNMSKISPRDLGKSVAKSRDNQADPCGSAERQRGQIMPGNVPLKSKQASSSATDNIPLPEKMRPKSLAEYIGQEKVVGKNKLLRSLLESDRIPSMILWGPPGCGKTTLAKIIASKCKESHMRFASLSATTAGIADVKEAIKIAKNEQKLFQRRTVLFIDEIHRFNKLQQDTFLPHVEDGTICLIGATTENPSFQVNNALLSRCRVIVLEKLSADNILQILRRALQELNVSVVPDTEQEPPNTCNCSVEEEALVMLSNMCDGDARSALNCLQFAVDSCLLNSSHSPPLITLHNIKEALQRSHVQYDRAGEEHYNCASALQKSIRGSSDNGAIYWLARMLEGGEDPLFIARRLVVTASEDIGMADPQALPLAVATFQACTFIGMPECAINLAHCTTYLARAPKSNESYCGLATARDMIRNHQGPLPGVPLHLRNAPTKLLKDIGYGKGYKYSHYHIGDTSQKYLPDNLCDVNFFHKNV